MSNLSDLTGPSDADLAAVEPVEAADLTVAEWAALLDETDPVIKVAPKFDEDYWNTDENGHDDRYDGEGMPPWSLFA